MTMNHQFESLNVMDKMAIVAYKELNRDLDACDIVNHFEQKWKEPLKPSTVKQVLREERLRRWHMFPVCDDVCCDAPEVSAAVITSASNEKCYLKLVPTEYIIGLRDAISYLKTTTMPLTYIQTLCDILFFLTTDACKVSTKCNNQPVIVHLVEENYNNRLPPDMNSDIKTIQANVEKCEVDGNVEGPCCSESLSAETISQVKKETCKKIPHHHRTFTESATCGKNVAQLRDLDTHKICHIEKKSPQCDKHRKPRSLKYHKATKHPEDEAVQSDYNSCGILLFDQDHVEIEIESNEEAKQNIWSQKGNIQVDMNLSGTIKRNKPGRPKTFLATACTMCGKEFKRQRDLDAHKQIHTGEKTLQCHTCGKCYRNQSTLRAHKIVTHHEHGDKLPYKCHICKKSFMVPSRLKHHSIQSHEEGGMKRNQCEVCGMRFFWRNALVRHMKTHNEVKEHKCEICKKSFNYTWNLKDHMKIHSDERPYQCNTCGRQFKHINGMKEHNRRHTGEKPFKCTVCSKTYVVSGSLQRHLRIHTGEKPFSCKICDRSFAWPRSLKKHMASHQRQEAIAMGTNTELKLSHNLIHCLPIQSI